MVIAPKGIIELYKGIPFNSNYTDTVNFTSLSEQRNYFLSKVYQRFTEQTYVRVSDNIIRINGYADDIFTCNYLGFQNITPNGYSKWYYAFIDSVNYKNNETCEIVFKLDLMQSYITDIEFLPCYILREHSKYNSILFDHEPEPMQPSRYIENTTQQISEGGHYGAILATELPENYDVNFPANAKVFIGGSNNMFCGYHIIYNLQTSNDIRNVIVAYESDANVDLDDIVTVFDYPIKYATFDNDKQQFIPYHNFHAINLPTSLEGYTPHNKKLLTYPYNFLRIMTNDGQIMDLKYEYFGDNSDMELYEYGTIYPSVDCMLVPENYNYSGKTKPCYTSSLTYKPSNDIGFSGNAYNNWLSINRLSLAIQAFSGIFSMAADDITGTGDMSGVWDVLNAGVTKEKAKAIPNNRIGTISSNIINRALNVDGFYIKQICIPSDEAIEIDTFLDRYGYACNQVKTPNITSRPHWNYLQTQNAMIKLNAPNSIVSEICTILNKGITFWHTPSEVGMYNLNNSI